jgi:UDPglucose 6-dehydrogenase
MKIGIIGMGFVGGTTAKVLEKEHEIIPYDKFKKQHQDYSRLKETEVVFICVPTPMKPSGEMDYSAIHNSIKTLQEVTSQSQTKPLVIIRSTAVSGTTDDLEKKYSFHFAFNPEFLREKHALGDMSSTNRIVIGANRQEDYEKLANVYKPIFPNAKYIQVDCKTAEMIKYAANVMLAGQISLANEIFHICQAVGVDYETVKNTILLDDRIAKNIDVPGPDGDFGFGGKCFPKDLNALIYLAREKRYRPHLLEEVWRLNEKVRKNLDWYDIPGATSENQNFEDKQD